MRKHAVSIAAAAAVAFTMQAALAADPALEESNKRLVADFYRKAINEKDFDAAAKYLGNRYVQHNQSAADGPEGLRKFIGFLRAKFPDAHSEIKRSFADGDFVILHVHSIRQRGTPGTAIVDIFRVENGKIVEHWDVHEDISEHPANQNGMF